ncbi:mCG1035241 [Mus musculus]|nr:mCG1035241 [Mus musculus]|eukprot:NP_001095070.1 uncharacterized protein LOC665389 [Mus musculus]
MPSASHIQVTLASLPSSPRAVFCDSFVTASHQSLSTPKIYAPTSHSSPTVLHRHWPDTEAATMGLTARRLSRRGPEWGGRCWEKLTTGERQSLPHGALPLVKP